MTCDRTYEPWPKGRARCTLADGHEGEHHNEWLDLWW